MKGFSGFENLTAGREVRVYMGWGWAKATVLEVQPASVLVKLASEDRRVRCYDIRNIRSP